MNATIDDTSNPNASANLDIGLKEWAIVCSALAEGRQALLLRKGGIYEAAGEFELEHSQFLLLPTYLHQNPESVKPPWRFAIQKVHSEPQQMLVNAWACVHEIFRVPDRPSLELLDDLYLWDKPLLDMRFSYRPDYPLYLILLKTFTLPKAITIPTHPDYAGCKSWVPLKSPVNTVGSSPVLDQPHIQTLSNRIKQAFHG